MVISGADHCANNVPLFEGGVSAGMVPVRVSWPSSSSPGLRADLASAGRPDRGIGLPFSCCGRNDVLRNEYGLDAAGTFQCAVDSLGSADRLLGGGRAGVQQHALVLAAWGRAGRNDREVVVMTPVQNPTCLMLVGAPPPLEEELDRGGETLVADRTNSIGLLPVGVARKPALTFGNGLGKVVLAAGAESGASANGIPSRIGPFDNAGSAHCFSDWDWRSSSGSA